METRSNPLSKYFRQPAIHLKLPSGGRYWPENALNLSVTGELPVYPLTTRDEITLRTPDALMNGSGVVDVIQSCVPDILDAWHTPGIDIDAVLIAIRIASYGERMDLESNCPHCRALNSHAVNLQNALQSIKCPDYQKVFEFDKIQIKFNPVTFFGKNRQNAVNFEQQKMLQAIEAVTMPDEDRAKIINDSMQRLVELSNQVLTDSTEYVKIDEDITVTEKEFILEFYNQVPSTLNKLIQTELGELTSSAGVKAQTVQCTECTKLYELPLIFDYSAFFAQGS